MKPISLLMMLAFLSACANFQVSESVVAKRTAADRQAHAAALTTDDLSLIRRTGLTLLEKLRAGFGES